MAIDPICKMTVDEKTAEYKTGYEGKTYYFCAPGCKTAFEENPTKYLNEESGSTKTHEMHHHDHSSGKKPRWKFW